MVMDTASVPVVLHFRGGRTEHCQVAPDISTDGESIHVTKSDGNAEDIPFDQLKAIFFLRPAGEPMGLEDHPGSTLAVEFSDGEIIRGKSTEYTPDRKGFFLYPVERSKNAKIFVVQSSIASIEIEKF